MIVKNTIAILITFFSFNCLSEELSALCESQQTADLTKCALFHYKEADVKLNRSYQIVLKEISDENKILFRESQRSWIKFRDDYCAAYDPSKEENGEEAAIEFYSCLSDITNSRVYEMQILDGSSDVFGVVLYKLATYYSESSVDDIKKNIYTKGVDNNYFDDYAKKNCNLNFLLSAEPKEDCLARVYFFGKK